MTLEDTRTLSVDVATLRRWRDSSEHVEVLDVRTPAEYEAGHIPGSVNIPWAQLPPVCEDVAGLAQRLERQVRLVAGSLVVGGVLGSVRYPPTRFFSGAVGGGLVFAAVTNTCAMANVLSRLPYNRRSQRDIRAAVDDLSGR